MGRERSPVGRAAPAFRTPPGGGVFRCARRCAGEGKGRVPRKKRRISTRFAQDNVCRGDSQKACRYGTMPTCAVASLLQGRTRRGRVFGRKIPLLEDSAVGRPHSWKARGGGFFGGAALPAGRVACLPVGPVFGSARNMPLGHAGFPEAWRAIGKQAAGATPSEKARRSTGTALRRWPPVRLRAAVRPSRLRP